MSKLVGYRTLLLNVLTFVLLALTGVTGSVTSPETLRYVALAITVLNFALRFLTTTPVGGLPAKEPPL